MCLSSFTHRTSLFTCSTLCTYFFIQDLCLLRTISRSPTTHSMKASNILPLLYCIEILGVLLCGVQSDVYPSGPSNTDEPSMPVNESLTPDQTTQEGNSVTINDVSQGTSAANFTSAASSTSEASNLMSSGSTVAPNVQSVPKYGISPSPGPHPTTTTTTTTSTPTYIFYRKECVRELMVTGGLIIACAILLVSTLLLIWKVCQLSRRIKMLSSNADLISNSEYWMGTATKDKSKSETEAKETSVLMADISQTQEEVGNSTTKEEEEEKVIEDGQMREENKKESEDTANSEEASADENKKETLVISDENPSAKAVAASSSSEGTEEPKDVV